MNQVSNKKVVYLAAGWFSPAQDKQLTQLEKIFDDRQIWIDLRSPRRMFVCPPTAPQDVQEETFQGNIKNIDEADFICCDTSYRDIGTIWEAGSAHAKGKPIVYFCSTLPPGAPFNLMLSRSGIKVCTTLEQLEDYLDRCREAGELLVEPYGGSIE